jgi:hypothetical protein
MFAFMNMAWWQVVLAVLAVGFLLRVSKRGRARGRRFFPWKAAALVVLGVIAVRHFGHPKFSFRLDDDRGHFVGDHVVDQRFPPVKDQDLWALRRAEEKRASADERKKRREEIEQRAEEVRQRAAEVASRADRRAEEPSDGELDAAIEALAVAKMAEARDLARRAIDQGKTIYARTKRDAKALAIMSRKKSEASDSRDAQASQPAVSRDAADAVSSSSVADGAPAAPRPVIPSPDTPVSPAPAAAPPGAQVSASAPTTPAVPVRRAVPVPERAATSSTSSPPATTAQGNKRPAWVDAPPGREGDVYYTAVMVGPHKDVRGCEDELPTELERAVKAYIDNYLGPGASQTFHVPQAFIQDRIVKHPYYFETKDFTETDPLLGEMTNLHVRLAFDGRVRSQLQRMWREARVENRLLEAGGVASLVLLFLGTIFGYLKLDTMTRGYYTRRLQFATAAVILATVAAAAMLVAHPRIESHEPPTHASPAILDRPSSIDVNAELRPAAQRAKGNWQRPGQRERM